MTFQQCHSCRHVTACVRACVHTTLLAGGLGVNCIAISCGQLVTSAAVTGHCDCEREPALGERDIDS